MNGDLFPSTEEKVFSCDGNQNRCPWLKVTFMSLCLHKKEAIPFSWLLYVLYTQSLQLRLILCDSMDCSPPGSSVHGILQATILECVAVPSSRGSSWPQGVNLHCLQFLNCRQILYCWAIREAQVKLTGFKMSINQSLNCFLLYI